MTARPASVSVRLVWPFQRVYARLGMGADEQLAAIRRLGISLEELADPELRVPLDLALENIERGAQRLGRTDLGLLAAQAALPGDFGPVEVAARACATAGEALDLLARAFELLADGVRLRVEPRGEQLCLRLWTAPEVTLSPRAAEFVLAALWQIGGAYLGVPLRIDRVRFVHSRVPHASACAEIFGCPIEFDAVENAVDVPRSTSSAPLATAHPLTAPLLRAHVEGRIAATATDDLLQRIERAVASELSRGLPSLASIRRTLGVSERTLHRRLSEGGTSYRKIRDDVRLRLALHYLDRTRMPIKEIAAQLGYHDAQAFHRAFRRTAGLTPQQRRRERQRSPT